MSDKIKFSRGRVKWARLKYENGVIYLPRLKEEIEWRGEGVEFCIDSISHEEIHHVLERRLKEPKASLRLDFIRVAEWKKEQRDPSGMFLK